MVNDKHNILVQLKRIIESKTFAKTTTNVKLLQFLVNESLNETELKEVTIGTEMFGKSYDPIRNDNKVRVYVYHLRKKLDRYYSEEAGKDEIIFTIAKGQYSVDFSTSAELNISFIKNKKLILWGVTAAIIVLLPAIVCFVLLRQDNNMFWQENLNNEYNTTVLIGDHYTIAGPIETGGSGIIRDFNINSESDYNNYLQKNPDKVSVIAPNPFSYITKMGAYCCKNISQYFDSKELDFDLMLSSEWDKSKINDENTVFIGQPKTMRFLKNILHEHFPQYHVGNYTITRTDPKTGVNSGFKDTSSDELIDYTLVAKITGPAGNSHKYFLSGHDGGVISTLNYFTNNDSIGAFYERHQIGSKDFIALFKVTGWERTGYNMDFVLIDFRAE